MGRVRSNLDAWHEAAHVAVGVSLGLRLKKAVLGDYAGNVVGYTHFATTWWGGRRRLALALMYAAGVAWCAMSGRSKTEARGDVQRMRELGFSEHDRKILAGTARAYLESRDGQKAHRRIAEALTERDLTGADVARILAGDHGA